MADVRQNPRIIVQADFDTAFREKEKAWVSFKQTDQPSVYGDLEPTGVSRTGVPFVAPSGKFKVHDVTKKSITVSYPLSQDQECKCRFQAPDVSFYSIHQNNKSVTSLDVTNGGLAVSADSEGHMKVWTTEDGQIRRELSGHIGDVTTCRFFPSGVVVLSGGMDMRIKVWSAETGQCAATFTGHKGGITETAVVDRGRNIVSSSRDGSAKLWDCSQQQCLASWEDLEVGPVNGCSLAMPVDGVLQTASCAPGEKEVATDGKLLLLACEANTLLGFSLRGREEVFRLQTDSAVNCCTAVSDTIVVAGTEDGTMYGLDLRNPSTPMAVVKERRSAILSFLQYKEGFFSTTGDGSCFYTTESLDTSLELVGADCDPIYNIVTDGKFHYTACRDGAVRKYRIES